MMVLNHSFFGGLADRTDLIDGVANSAAVSFLFLIFDLFFVFLASRSAFFFCCSLNVEDFLLIVNVERISLCCWLYVRWAQPKIKTSTKRMNNKSSGFGSI